MHKISRQSGFTLIEMAIVIVIIGLIIGGVEFAQTMIREAQLKSIISDIQKYRSAINAFKSEYQALPGDIPNATSFWGFAAGTTGLDQACYDALGTGTQTCNGNNDGQINWGSGSPSAGAREDLRAWQHLSNAGLIDSLLSGTYTGTTNLCGTCTAIGVNVPKSRISGSGYSLAYLGTTTGDTQLYDANYGNVLFFGIQTSGGITNSGSITPEEASLIDTKLDDGNPTNGKILSWKSTVTPNCTTADTVAGLYNIASGTTKACALIFKTDW